MRASDSSLPNISMISNGPGDAFLPDNATRTGHSKDPLSPPPISSRNTLSSFAFAASSEMPESTFSARSSDFREFFKPRLFKGYDFSKICAIFFGGDTSEKRHAQVNQFCH